MKIYICPLRKLNISGVKFSIKQPFGMSSFRECNVQFAAPYFDLISRKSSKLDLCIYLIHAELIYTFKVHIFQVQTWQNKPGKYLSLDPRL